VSMHLSLTHFSESRSTLYPGMRRVNSTREFAIAYEQERSNNNIASRVNHGRRLLIEKSSRMQSNFVNVSLMRCMDCSKLINNLGYLRISI